MYVPILFDKFFIKSIIGRLAKVILIIIVRKCKKTICRNRTGQIEILIKKFNFSY